MNYLTEPLTRKQIVERIQDGRIVFRMKVSLGDLVEFNGIDGLNDAAEEALGGYGSFVGLQDLGFKVVGQIDDATESNYCNGSVIIEVNAMLDPNDVE